MIAVADGSTGHVVVTKGRTALIAASNSGFEDIVKLLLDKIYEFPDEVRQKYLDHGNIVSIYTLNNGTQILVPL